MAQLSFSFQRLSYVEKHSGSRRIRGVRVAIFTGSRAEFGFLRHLARTMQSDSFLRPLLLVSGSHLDQRAGSTLVEVEELELETLISRPVIPQEETGHYVADYLATAIREIALLLDQVPLEALIVLGDRIEAMAAALAAHSKNIPIVHLHGGERTHLVLDEGYRNAISKLASIHFVTTDQYRKNVVALDEDPRRVLNVGALAVEATRQVPSFGRDELERRLGVQVDRLLLTTFHPVTLLKDRGLGELHATLTALEGMTGFSICVTGSNLDGALEEFANAIIQFVAKDPTRRTYLPSLGSDLYLNALRAAKACIGNSSSGLLEAPIVGTPSVNVGTRQQGRLSPRSVISCDAQTEQILSSLFLATSNEFRAQCVGAGDVFGDGRTSLRITDHLKDFSELGQLNKWNGME